MYTRPHLVTDPKVRHQMGGSADRGAYPFGGNSEPPRVCAELVDDLDLADRRHVVALAADSIAHEAARNVRRDRLVIEVGELVCGNAELCSGDVELAELTADELVVHVGAGLQTLLHVQPVALQTVEFQPIAVGMRNAENSEECDGQSHSHGQSDFHSHSSEAVRTPPTTRVRVEIASRIAFDLVRIKLKHIY